MNAKNSILLCKACFVAFRNVCKLSRKPTIESFLGNHVIIVIQSLNNLADVLYICVFGILFTLKHLFFALILIFSC